MKPRRQHVLYDVNYRVEHVGSHRREESDAEGEDDSRLTVGKMLRAPSVQPFFQRCVFLVNRSLFHLLAYDGYLSVLSELDNAARSVRLVLLATSPAHIVDSLQYLRRDVAVVLCRRFAADIGACAHDSLLETVAKLL